MEILRYRSGFEPQLFDLIESEGDDWIDYHGAEGRGKYKKALETSIVYIAFDGNTA